MISGTFLSVGIAFLLFQSEVRDGAMGKAAYLASQGIRYDKYLAKPHFGVMIFTICLLGLIFLIYEMLSYGIYHVLAPRAPKDDAVIHYG